MGGYTLCQLFVFKYVEFMNFEFKGLLKWDWANND